MMSGEIEIYKTKKNSSLHWSESVLKKLSGDETAHQIHVAIRFYLLYVSYCMIDIMCLIVSYKCIVFCQITAYHITPRSLFHLVLDFFNTS